jgi:2-deoxy-D-gluconate 3-dehydrogenase
MNGDGNLPYFSELKERKVIVVGGSRGIGRDIALAFARLGSDVIITGRKTEDLQRTCEELNSLHSGCSWMAADITDVRQVYDMIDRAHERLGRIDVLVNNAGINIAKPALEVTEEDWDRVLDTNLKGTFFCSQRAASYMIKQDGIAKIINIVSQMAFVGFYHRAAYCSSKGGAVQLTKALAIEWSRQNIRVNAVAPTFIETELTRGMFADQSFYEEVLRRIPLGTLAEPRDVTNAVLFLASDMSNFITGETIRVDGGWTAI